MPEVSVPDGAIPTLLEQLVKVPLAVDEDLSLRLFVNDFTPGHSTVAGDFTEPAGNWYSQRVVQRGDWAGCVMNVHLGTIRLAAGPQSYTYIGAGETLYGCFLVGALTGLVYYAKRFSVPRVLVNGESFGVDPVVTFRSELY